MFCAFLCMLGENLCGRCARCVNRFFTVAPPRRFPSNSRWPEILNELAPGQSAADRPDIVLRVFRARVLALRPHLEAVFCPGGVSYSLTAWEFQHRGEWFLCPSCVHFLSRNMLT